LVEVRDREVVIVCRSGYRSVLAAQTLTLLGHGDTKSLRTGLRGWNDYELPLFDSRGNPVEIDDADEYFIAKLRPEQIHPDRRPAADGI